MHLLKNELQIEEKVIGFGAVGTKMETYNPTTQNPMVYYVGDTKEISQGKERYSDDIEFRTNRNSETLKLVPKMPYVPGVARTRSIPVDRGASSCFPGESPDLRTTRTTSTKYRLSDNEREPRDACYDRDITCFFFYMISG